VNEPDPTAILSLEHREIDRVLVAVSLVVLRPQAEAELDGEFVAAMVDFIERFADGSHHAKEEQVLFAEAQARGSRLSGPLACMSSQHEHGRDLTRAMKAWVTGGRSFRATHLPNVRHVIERYVTLLWNHVATEDLVVFPALRSAISPRSAERVLARYAEVAPEPHEAFRQAADSVVVLARSVLRGRVADEQLVAAAGSSRSP
jgi:hemerythrin-like domain-containing protein